jgi:hypothetical protein
MIILERAGRVMGPIGRDPVVELRLRPAVAAHQDGGLDDLRMLAGEHESELRADAAAEHDGTGGHVLVGQHAENVAGHIAQQERRPRLGRAAPSTQVHGKGAETRREPLHLVEPQVVIERQRVDEHERRPRPGGLIVDVEAVGAADGHC